ncbi:hypothetical protein PMYN1_Chma131 (chromatophore) [Paulinella micropora]|uniref:YGGT family, conserved hypothetical integral membrane protein n=1 Tax=Paulinella micropora TaxID=1928728 RepID=A0A1L5YB94_9EUKA|nr:YGGT family, conserved hypothetical integral membrane protein [Paulinella micropora]AQX44731.1 YGGT family, conserved hypothetical integral membrane protein [Paulinella micropora]BBL85943.1 hypothetical protein PMYN1_Chma131 [Paulinella micropora]
MLRHVIISFLQVSEEILNLYFYVLFIRVVISWFPDLNRNNPAIEWFYTVGDPYLMIFRSIIPMVGTLDLSPLFAFLFLNLTQKVINNIIGVIMDHSAITVLTGH